MSEGLNIHQISEIRREIELIKTLLTETEPEIKKRNAALRQEISLLTTTMVLTRRMGLPDDADAAIAKVQRLTTMLLTLRATLLAVQVAAGPVGWAIALVGAGGTIITAADAVGGLASP